MVNKGNKHLKLWCQALKVRVYDYTEIDFLKVGERSPCCFMPIPEYTRDKEPSIYYLCTRRHNANCAGAPSQNWHEQPNFCEFQGDMTLEAFRSQKYHTALVCNKTVSNRYFMRVICVSVRVDYSYAVLFLVAISLSSTSRWDQEWRHGNIFETSNDKRLQMTSSHQSGQTKVRTIWKTLEHLWTYDSSWHQSCCCLGDRLGVCQSDNSNDDF